MKNHTTAIFIMFVFSLAMFPYVHADDKEKLYWYEVTIIHGTSPYEFYGTSSYNSKQFVQEMKNKKFIKLDNLMFRQESGEKSNVDASIYKSWKEWDPLKQTHIYLNVDYIVAVHPLVKNPADK